jgi:hypothetical protein
MTEGDWEFVESNTFLELLESHETILDIGANMGVAAGR